MKNNECKDRLLLWLRKSVSLNLDKQKYHTFTPLASDGFVFNLISTLLQLCKPFTGNFQKFGNFLNKINCFYLQTDQYIDNAMQKFESLEHGVKDKIKAILTYQCNDNLDDMLSGVTMNPFVEGSSLMGDNEGR